MRKFLTIFTFLALAGSASIAHANTSIPSIMPQNAAVVVSQVVSSPVLPVVPGATFLSKEHKAATQGASMPWFPCWRMPDEDDPFGLCMCRYVLC